MFWLSLVQTQFVNQKTKFKSVLVDFSLVFV
jgi:hypothetical protein